MSRPVSSAAPARAAAPGSERLRSPSTQQLVIYGSTGSPALAWHVEFNTRQPVADWHVMVSARTGKVLASWNAIHMDDGSGLTYDPNPVQRPVQP